LISSFSGVSICQLVTKAAWALVHWRRKFFSTLNI
jgi:hypothetical protein